MGVFLYILWPHGSLQRTLLWDWQFLPPPKPPQVFIARDIEALVSHAKTLGLRSLSRSPVDPPGLSTHECGTTWSTSHCLACPVPLPCQASSPSWLPFSAPPTDLDKYFFFNSLVVGLPSWGKGLVWPEHRHMTILNCFALCIAMWLFLANKI